MELVRRVTGHQTVDVVLKHYFRPGRSDFQKTLLATMPKLLTGEGPVAAKKPAQTVIDILSAATAETWQDAIAKAIEALRRIDVQTPAV